jgi:hypothetical protein
MIGKRMPSASQKGVRKRDIEISVDDSLSRLTIERSGEEDERLLTSHGMLDGIAAVQRNVRL